MVDDHFSRETLERFFRSELSREESRGFVRHLLRQCPQCSGLLREVSRRGSFQLLVRGLQNAALRSNPDHDGRTLARVSLFPARGAQAGPEEEMKRSGRIGRG